MNKDNKLIVKEARLLPRRPVELKVRYSILGSSEDQNMIYEVVTKNVSSSGLLFRSEKLLPLDTKLKLILVIPDLCPKSLEAIGKVVRIEKLSSSADFGIGIIFTDIDEAVKEEIKVRLEQLDVVRLLEKINKEEISDVHLTVNSPAIIRRFGELKPLNDKILSEEEIRQMIICILSEKQRERFETVKDLDFSFSPLPNVRFRVSVYQQRGKMEVVFRNIIANIKNTKELGLPDVIEELCELKNGIVILGGTTGSGKSTTIASMTDSINRSRAVAILSLERPIEYLHRNIKSIIKQREVGVDVSSFANGLRSALRQDPDIIVVGEIQDPDSVEAVLQAAETGHLVITSLHATDTIQVFDRLISFFPLEQRNFIYRRLSHSLRAVIIQSLLPHKNGTSRVLATEVCIVNTAVRRIIHSGEFTQLPSVIQTGLEYKMHLMQNSIDKLFEQGLIDGETYEAYMKKQGV